MAKKIYIKFALLFIAINLICFVNLYAAIEEVEVNENNVNNSETTQESEELKLQKEQLNNMIKQLLDEILVKINYIDQRVEEIRSTEEYETYPAIRLNMDTPLFGLVKVTNNKLNITQDVSAADVASGYSIRTVIKNRSIKLPDVTFAGIVVSTRDVKLNEDIELSDANNAVLKLMQYSQKADSAIEFLDKQINKNFREYIPKEKLEQITELQRRLSKLEENLVTQDMNTIKLDMLVENKEEQDALNNYYNTFKELSSNIKQSKIVVDNVLIADEALRDAQRDVIDIEARSLELTDGLEKALLSQKENINLEVMLNRMKERLENRQKSIEEYVLNSVEKREVKKDEEVVNENNNSDEQIVDEQNTNLDENITIEEIKKYDVTSADIVGILKQDIDNIETLIEKYFPTKVEGNEEQVETAEENNVEKEEITLEEKESVLEQLYDIYKDYITRENKFYTANVNSQLKATTSKTTDISKYTDSNVLEEMKYIYLELPETLEDYLDYCNTSLYIEVEDLSNKLSEQLNKLVDTYLKMEKIYEDLNVDDVKSKA
jgi:hypothetical protein